MDIISQIHGIVYSNSKSKNHPKATECAEILGISTGLLSKRLSLTDKDSAYFRAIDIEPVYNLYKHHGGHKIIEHFAQLGNCMAVKMPVIRAKKLLLMPLLMDGSAIFAKATEAVYAFLDKPSGFARDVALELLKQNLIITLKIMKAIEYWRDGELPFGE